ncbi:Type I inositol polyphosphate 5-phosphatase 5, variant 2 [Ancistrocladus abbreviatus]
MAPSTEVQRFRMFIGTWNVGGRTPYGSINLEDFLQVEDSSDIYVLGFQEIVPLNAGNVLVLEDNEPAAKWLALINQALNRPQHDSLSPSHGLKFSKESSKSNFFQKPALKVVSKNLKVDSSLLKACNCCLNTGTSLRWMPKRRQFHDPSLQFHCRGSIEEFLSMVHAPSSPSVPCRMNYRLIASKQMVGLFLSVWARNELVPHIGHFRVCSIGRGICSLGNKGCISVSMTLHRTSFCFICSHLASGEKEGDELKRNLDVAEILKRTQFPSICKNSNHQAPEKITDHDRAIWFGDLNYRVSLSYEETRTLLEDNKWDSLLEKDQLNIERKAGRAFKGWEEGRILFAPTYKYSQNSDSYAGETAKSKKKRRTPAWCDRILWHGSGIEQLCYVRGESRFSDHRPVCAHFSIEVEVRSKSARCRKGYSCMGRRIDYDDSMIHQRCSFYDF